MASIYHPSFASSVAWIHHLSPSNRFLVDLVVVVSALAVVAVGVIDVVAAEEGAVKAELRRRSG